MLSRSSDRMYGFEMLTANIKDGFLGEEDANLVSPCMAPSLIYLMQRESCEAIALAY